MNKRILFVVLVLVLGSAMSARAGKPRKDVHGDPLPKQAIARLGSIRFQHGGYVRGLAFSPDGTMLASLGYSSQGTRGLVIWNSQNGKPIKQIDTSGSNGLSVDWSPDGNSVAFVDSSKAAYICDIRTEKKRRIKIGSYCYRVEYSPDGESVFAAARDGVYQFRVRDGKRLKKWADAAASLSVGGGGKYLASANSKYNKRKGRPIRLFDLETGKQLHEWRQKKTRFTDVAVSSDGNYVAAAPSNYGRGGVKLLVWDIKSGKKVREIKVQTRYVRRVEFIPGTTHLVTLGAKGTVEVVDVSNGKRIRRIDVASGATQTMAVAPNGKYVAAAGRTMRIGVYDLDKGQPTYKPMGHTNRVMNLAFSPDGKRLVSASYDKTVRIWNIETSRAEHVLRGHDSYAYDVAWSQDGSRVASVQISGNTGAIVWNPDTGKKVRQFKNVPTYSMDLVFRNGGQELVVAGRKGGVQAWNVQSGKRTRRVSVDTPNRRGYFYSVALSPNGRMFAAFGRKLFKLVSLDSKKTFTLASSEQIMYGHQNAAFSPDGFLMAWSGRKRVHVIETVSGQEVVSFDRGHGGRDAVTFSHDGRYLASSRRQDDIDVYDLAMGKRVARYTGHGGSGGKSASYNRYGTSCLAFSPDDAMLASGGGKGTVLVWDFDSARSKSDQLGKNVDLDACWTDLADHDARRAYTAYWQLSRKDDETVAYLADALKPVEKPKATLIQRNIDHLDAEDYQARRKAYAALARFGPVVEREINRALKGDLSLAGRRRLKELLRVMDSPTSRSPAVLRQLRAVRLLQKVASPEAREILRELTKGVKEAPQTRAARQALELLAARDEE
jgi:WD40 repeat protein